MAQVFPFQPLRYSSKAGDASDLVTQPYDKIPDELRERYLAASPYNFVRLIKRKGEGDEVYKQAADLLDDWIASGILEQDPEPQSARVGVACVANDSRYLDGQLTAIVNFVESLHLPLEVVSDAREIVHL